MCDGHLKSDGVPWFAKRRLQEMKYIAEGLSLWWKRLLWGTCFRKSDP
jgi:hypothetical protein